MTTIVATKSAMACDSQLTNGKMRDGNVKKMWRLIDGSLLGVCGDWEQCLDFVRVLRYHSRHPSAIDLDQTWKSVEALRCDGKNIWSYEGNLKPYKLRDPWASLGTGADVAKGALLMGATPLQAVQCAKKVDTRTGGRVTQLKVKT